MSSETGLDTLDDAASEADVGRGEAEGDCAKLLVATGDACMANLEPSEGDCMRVFVVIGKLIVAACVVDGVCTKPLVASGELGMAAGVVELEPSEGDCTKPLVATGESRMAAGVADLEP